ncbi:MULTISPECIES: hypothetical protein [Staphylococcus]|uniref:hypothetical protein n=1 Tax=Staphylococcus TaxID=1279 RepID=UPI001954BF16|nr:MULTISPECIES: hypothetical protein [Staphylococcus]MCT2553874.1 hypothetical protein [Staphylococcus aureus]MCT2569038.1 hypothetical protein [Staphylococcus aureus]MCT2572830.1 hypothetical protein [Staphylococcus aureus]MCT2575561.1 hypothetical protein [Staphylococcus aureus]MEA1207914.1 hypothetical protein [Staphylococcus aureus]
MKDIENVFEVSCFSFCNRKTTDFYYSSMIDNDVTYYYLKDIEKEPNYISCFSLQKRSVSSSKFDHIKPIEKYHISEISIVDHFNQGLMTIMICDILLTIFNREFGYRYNVVISLGDLSYVPDSRTSVNPYKSVFPNYLGKFIECNDDRVEKHKDSAIFQYFFSIDTREDDINYYEKLKKEKLNKFKTYLINRD